MNGKTRFTAKGLALVAAAIVVAGLAAWLPAQTLATKLCCIAGDYKGSQAADPLPNCPTPKSEKFAMTILQARCGADIAGTITDASGHVSEFKGALSRGLKGCCVLNASFSDPGRPGHLVSFTGTFCQRMNKWRAKGTYKETNSGDPCKKGGTWEITQL
jgi:hypothetical protein